MKKRKWMFPAVLAVTIGIGVLVMYSIWGAVAPRTAAQYLESGKQYFDQGKYPEAGVELLNALQKDPRASEAHLLLARTYLAQEDGNSAVKQLRELLEYAPENRDASIQLGNIYLTGGRRDPAFFRQAKEIAEKLLAKDSKDVGAMVLLGNALAGLQDYSSSTQQFEQALKLDPQNASTLVSLGATEAIQKNFAEAEQAFLKAREADPKSKPALLSLGAFLATTGKASEAEKIFKEALALYPADRQTYLAAVAFYSQSKRFEEAERILKEAQAKSATDPTPSLVLADYYKSRNRVADAKSVLQDSKTKFAKNNTVSLQLVSLLLLDEPAEARKEIDDILKTDPQNVQAKVLLGELQFRARQYDQAVATLDVPSLLNSRFPEVHLYLGLIDASKGQTDKALDHYKKSLDQNAGYLPSRLALAGQLLRLGRVADTKVEIEKVLEAQPGNVEARLIKASVDALEGKFPDADREFAALQKEQPDSAAVHLRTASYYQMRRKMPDAEKGFLRALALEPGSDDILQSVAQFYLLQRAPDRAIKVIHDSVPDEKKRAFHYELIGRVNSRAGRSADAETALRKALQMEPDRVDARAALVEEYIRTTRFDDALKEIDELLKQMPTNFSAYESKAGIFQARGNLDLARENYDRALKINPNLFVSANNLAYILAEQGKDLELALTYAQTARRLQPELHASADTLGWVQHKLGRDVLAREQLQFAVSKQPDNPTYQYHLAMIYKGTNQIPQAQAALKKALASKADFKERSLAEVALKEMK